MEASLMEMFLCDVLESDHMVCIQLQQFPMIQQLIQLEMTMVKLDKEHHLRCMRIDLILQDHHQQEAIAHHPNRSQNHIQRMKIDNINGHCNSLLMILEYHSPSHQ